MADFTRFSRQPVAEFRADPRGRALFNGPSDYVSPGMVSKPQWGPTWNYAVLRFTVDVEFVGDETHDAIAQLAAMMEGDDWSTGRMGVRYHQPLGYIVAFRAHVCSVEHSFKLGQDESRPSFAKIIAGHPDRALAEWMEGQADE